MVLNMADFGKPSARNRSMFLQMDFQLLYWLLVKIWVQCNVCSNSVPECFKGSGGEVEKRGQNRPMFSNMAKTAMFCSSIAFTVFGIHANDCGLRLQSFLSVIQKWKFKMEIKSLVWSILLYYTAQLIQVTIWFKHLLYSHRLDSR